MIIKKAIWCILMLLALCAAIYGCGGQQSLSPSSISESAAPESAASESTASESTASESAAPESAASSVASSTPEASQPQQTDAAWWRAGLAKDKLVYPSDPNMPSCNDPVSLYYLYDNAKKTADYCGELFAAGNGDSYEYGDLSLLLSGAREASDIGARILPDSFCEIVALDDTKYTIDFYEKGVMLTQSLPGDGKGKTVLLEPDAENYAEMLSRIPTLLAPDGKPADIHFPAWLCMMRSSRAVTVKFRTADGSAEKSYNMVDAPSWLWDDLRGIQISGSGKTSALRSLEGDARAEITFNNGLVYNLYITEKELLVTADDMDYSLLYTTRFSSTKEIFEAYAEGRVNPPTGKPVIYLYPTEPTQCAVTVDYGEFISTIPEYNGGWRVTAYPDGRLVNLADGAEYPYLFWDGDRAADWDFSSGFCVAQTELESFLREKLSYLGLVPAEYEEFIEYWLPRMQRAPYYLLTFAGEQYETLAPMHISPAPDSLLRVHMVFCALPAPVDIPEQQLAPFERNGFAVIEWGGTDADMLRK